MTAYIKKHLNLLLTPEEERLENARMLARKKMTTTPQDNIGQAQRTVAESSGNIQTLTKEIKNYTYSDAIPWIGFSGRRTSIAAHLECDRALPPENEPNNPCHLDRHARRESYSLSLGTQPEKAASLEQGLPIEPHLLATGNKDKPDITTGVLHPANHFTRDGSSQWK